MLATRIPSYYKARRDALMKANRDSVFILPAAPEAVRNSDVTYPYRQESYFHYLSAFSEPESFLVLAPTGASGSYKMALFVRHRDPEKEMWLGERYGVEGAINVFGADEAFVVEEFDKKLPEYLKDASKVYYRLGFNEAMDRRILAALDAFRRSLGRTGKGILPIVDPTDAIAEMRLFKTAEEVEILGKSCHITALAHKEVMKAVKPGMNEAEVEAFIEYQFRKGGAQRVGFGTIVAGGKNAACLHYTSNNEPLRDGELILVDAGGEYDYYSADITRTFPVGRKFTSAQAKVYDLVLKSQVAGIEMAKPGTTLAEIHKKVTEVLVDGFVSLGLLSGTRDEIISSGAHKRFFPHNTSHWLGLDVHDVGFYLKDGSPRKLEPGMVFSVEPGFYVQPGDTQTPAEYRNIGIRIEDDVLITEKGCEVLTSEVPKKREEIEALRG